MRHRWCQGWTGFPFENIREVMTQSADSLYASEFQSNHFSPQRRSGFTDAIAQRQKLRCVIVGMRNGFANAALVND